MDDYLCVTVWSRSSESESSFKARLSACWTHLLRNHPDDFEKVYAETSAFQNKDNRLSRQYLIEAIVGTKIEALFQELGIDFDPIDDDERYSKYEAAPPEWFWIEH